MPVLFNKVITAASRRNNLMRCPFRAKSDGKLVLWLGGIVPSAMEDGSSQRMMDSGVFLKLVFEQGLWLRRRDEGKS
ncbi:MAG: hypothetical protein Q8O38_16435, partial [Sulfurimicrobium sp.]|nr:hypothetical protein [Sulfurimicrobium sp.]